MNTLDDAFIKTIELMDKLKTDYIVIGGLAVGLLGEARMTEDVDILISFSKKDITFLLECAKEAGFKFNKAHIENDISLKGAFRLLYGVFHVDFIRGSMPFEKEAFKRSKKVKICNHMVRIPTPEDLILLKLIPGREKDIMDIKSIIARNKGNLDIKHIEKWAQIISDDLQDMSVWNRLRELNRGFL